MKIAICEDDVKMAGQIENIAAECFTDSNKYECDMYFSGETLVEKLRTQDYEYQMYLLDIEMKAIDGLETARYIRSYDSHAVIIFITSHVELMPEAFEVQAFHFLVKPLDHVKVKTTILRAVEMMQAGKKVFQYNIRKRLYSVYCEEIEYFESYNRKITIHCADRQIEYYGTMNEVLEKTDDNLFVQVHKSYVVNMNCVKIMSGESVILNSGVEIAITKKYARSFNIAYKNFILKRINP